LLPSPLAPSELGTVCLLEPRSSFTLFPQSTALGSRRAAALYLLSGFHIYAVEIDPPVSGLRFSIPDVERSAGKIVDP